MSNVGVKGGPVVMTGRTHGCCSCAHTPSQTDWSDEERAAPSSGSDPMAGPDSINSGPSHMYCRYTHKHFLAHVICRELTLVRSLTRIKINLFNFRQSPSVVQGACHATPPPESQERPGAAYLYKTMYVLYSTVPSNCHRQYPPPLTLSAEIVTHIGRPCLEARGGVLAGAAVPGPERAKRWRPGRQTP